MNKILLLEDLPEIRAWLKALALQVFPQAHVFEAARVHDALALFPALQAGAFGYLLKEQPREHFVEQLQRISQGEPPLSPSIARRVIAYFAAQNKPQERPQNLPHVSLSDRENEVLLWVAKGFTL